MVSAFRQISRADRDRDLVELKPPPQRLFADSAPTTGRRNYFRFALAQIRHRAGRPRQARRQGVRRRAARTLLVDEQPGQETAYTRLLGDAMAGDGALFTREDAVEAAWAVVDSFSQLTPGLMLTSEAVGVRARRTQSSPATAAGATSGLRTRPNNEPPSGVSARLARGRIRRVGTGISGRRSRAR